MKSSVKLTKLNKASDLLLVVAALAFLLTSLSELHADDSDTRPENGRIEGLTYTVDEIGWTMEIPEGWEVMSTQQVQGFQKKGKEAISDSEGIEIEDEGLQQLLNLHAGKLYLFQSTMEPYDTATDGDWNDNNEKLRELVINTYRNLNIKVVASPIESETIDGVEFNVWKISLSVGNGKVFLKQMMYSCLRNGCDFGVNITFHNDDVASSILAAWRASKFSQLVKKDR